MADISQIKLPNGDTFDIIDEKSGYITAQYIENKTDYAIPVSRVGEIVVGETPIGTDSTNFPTSKAVVDYVDERVVQEIEAIDVGVSSVNGKTGAVTISASDVGAATQTDINELRNEIDSLDFPDTKVRQESLDSSDGNSRSLLLARTANASTETNISYKSTSLTYEESVGRLHTPNLQVGSVGESGQIQLSGIILVGTNTNNPYTVTIPAQTGTIALTSDIPKVYSSSNTGGYLTMATLPKYDGTVE